MVACFEKKVYFKVKIDIFLTFKLINLFGADATMYIEKIQVFCFAYENMTKTPSKVED